MGSVVGSGLAAPRLVGSSRTRDRTHVPCIGRGDSQLLEHQGSPWCLFRFFKICTWQPLKAVMNPQVIRRKMGVRDIQLVLVGSEPAPEPCCPVPSLVLLLTSARGADALLRVFCCGSACSQLPGDVTSSVRVSPASRSPPCSQSRSTPADSAAPNDVKLLSTRSVRSDI